MGAQRVRVLFLPRFPSMPLPLSLSLSLIPLQGVRHAKASGWWAWRASYSRSCPCDRTCFRLGAKGASALWQGLEPKLVFSALALVLAAARDREVTCGGGRGYWRCRCVRGGFSQSAVGAKLTSPARSRQVRPAAFVLW